MRRIGAVSLVLAMVATAGWLTFIDSPSATPGRPEGSREVYGPTPGRDAEPVPFGTPAPLRSRSNSYRFMETQIDGKSPVAYDPCRPIHFVVRAQGAPIGGRQLITEAIARVASITGLIFIDDGDTTEAPDRRRSSFQPERYGDRWAPVLITWVTAAENPDFAADVAGEAGSVAFGREGTPRVFVSGSVQLDAEQLSNSLAQPRGRRAARAVVLHELGHLVGLAHVNDKNQLMYPETGARQLDYGDGDLTGLVALAGGACVPSL